MNLIANGLMNNSEKMTFIIKNERGFKLLRQPCIIKNLEQDRTEKISFESSKLVVFYFCSMII